MGAKSQIKGASGEREFCKVLGNLIGIDCLERNLEQRRSGGHDINVNQAARPTLLAHERETLDRLNQLAIEIKRHRSATGADIGQWWSQTCQSGCGYQEIADTGLPNRPWPLANHRTVFTGATTG